MLSLRLILHFSKDIRSRRSLFNFFINTFDAFDNPLFFVMFFVSIATGD